MAEVKVLSPSKSEPMAIAQAEDEIHWEEGRSSPFSTEVVLEEGTVRKTSGKRELTNMTLDFSPSKQLKMEAASFEICEDHTSMTAREESTPCPSTIQKNSITSLSAVEDTLLIDDTVMANEEEEEGIDDTCFSAFSEIPNMDMTKFARMGNNSPFKNSVMDQVRTIQHTCDISNH
jgi:hypothetical protein